MIQSIAHLHVLQLQSMYMYMYMYVGIAGLSGSTMTALYVVVLCVWQVNVSYSYM